jgi:hypothetical protein
LKPITLFFINLCGIVPWNEVIPQIYERSNKREGTELIFNWSYEAINRNVTTQYKENVLSKICAISEHKINTEFENITKMKK